MKILGRFTCYSNRTCSTIKSLFAHYFNLYIVRQNAPIVSNTVLYLFYLLAHMINITVYMAVNFILIRSATYIFHGSVYINVF